MNYSEALDYIHSLGNFSLPAGLDRITAVLERLLNPQNSFHAIHIAGTNGKGSTAAMLAEVLKTAGYKTAFFTSPYIIDFRERIQINGEYIPKEDLASLADTVKAVGIELTEFEFITAVAFLYFSEQRCDIAVVEAGLGGRLDATNTLNNVIASVITKIGLDHTAILGDTIEQIAAEKCGIIKSAPLITIIRQDKKALDVIKKHTNTLIIPEEDRLEILKSDLSGNEFLYKGKRYKTALLGDYQIENALTVIETLDACEIDISYEDVALGIENTRFPARMESFMDGRIILDGAHNPDGAEALSAVLAREKGPKTAIIGMMRDKDIKTVLKQTLVYFDRVITVRAACMPRAVSAEELCELASEFCKEASAAQDYKSALSLATSSEDRVFIFGSLYLASGIRPLLLQLK